MQNSVPKGVGGMLAILGATTENIENIINENSNKFTVQIANDNSDGQIVVSGKLEDLKKMIDVLKTNSIMNYSFFHFHLHISLPQCRTRLLLHNIMIT